MTKIHECLGVDAEVPGDGTARALGPAQLGTLFEQVLPREENEDE